MTAETFSPPSPDAESSHQAQTDTDSKRIVAAGEFAARAEDIFNGLNYLRDQGATDREAYGKISTEYINDEESPELALFSEVILATPVILFEQRRAEQQLRHDPGAAEEYRDTIRTITNYHHKLRDLLYNNPQAFKRESLVEWLEKAAGNAREEVIKMVNGIGAEVAVKKELNAMPEVISNRFASVEEDIKGTDLVVSFSNGATSFIDVKHGELATLGGYDRRRDSDTKIILGIGPESLQDFRVKRDSQTQVRKMILAGAGLA